MVELTNPLYEGMFLINQNAAGDLAAVHQHLVDIFARAEAEVLTIRRWDERKLAYPIAGQKRGMYILAFFRARGTQIANIDRDCNLSETILRSMIMRADHLGETELEAEKQETQLDQEAQMRGAAAAEDESKPEQQAEESAPAADEAVASESPADETSAQ